MFAIALIIAATAGPVDWQVEADYWQDLRSICMGVEESPMPYEQACKERDLQAKKLEGAGYCFDTYEFEWIRCEILKTLKRP